MTGRGSEPKIVPAVLVELSVLNRTYAVLPLVTAGEVDTLHNTTAWEAEHARVQVVKCLCQILAHTILTTFPCVGREQ